MSTQKNVSEQQLQTPFHQTPQSCDQQDRGPEGLLAGNLLTTGSGLQGDVTPPQEAACGHSQTQHQQRVSQ